MFDTEYVKKESELLDKIAKTLRELDRAVTGLNVCGNEKECDKAERKAMREIRAFCKQADKLDNLQGKKISYDDYGTPEDYARQNQALRDIQARLGSLREEAEALDVDAIDEEQRQALKDALREVRQILRATGRFDDYAEDERDRIINGMV